MKQFSLFIIFLESKHIQALTFYNLWNQRLNFFNVDLASNYFLPVMLNSNIYIFSDASYLRPNTASILEKVDVFSSHGIREFCEFFSRDINFLVLSSQYLCVPRIQKLNLIFEDLSLFFHFV